MGLWMIINGAQLNGYVQITGCKQTGAETEQGITCAVGWSYQKVNCY